MTNEELDKLESALELTDRYLAGEQISPQDKIVDANRMIREASRAHLAAQRQAPSDRAAALDALAWLNGASAKYEYDNFLRHPDVFKHLETIRAALTNSVPVDVVRKAMTAMKSAQDIFHHYGDLHQAKGTDEGNEKAFVSREHAAALGKIIRELEPWVNEVKHG